MELISREELKYVITSIIKGVDEVVSSWDEKESREMAVHKAVMSKCVEAMSILAGGIDQMPTIESRPKGKWIEKEYDEWYCSNCERKALYYFGKPFGEYKVFQVKSEYCPHCGAKMEEEK